MGNDVKIGIARRSLFSKKLSFITKLLAVLQFLAGTAQISFMGYLLTKVGTFAYLMPELQDKYGAQVLAHGAGGAAHLICSACILSRQKISPNLAIALGVATFLIQVKYLMSANPLVWLHLSIMVSSVFYSVWFHLHRKEFVDEPKVELRLRDVLDE